MVQCYTSSKTIPFQSLTQNLKKKQKEERTAWFVETNDSGLACVILKTYKIRGWRVGCSGWDLLAVFHTNDRNVVI